MKLSSFGFGLGALVFVAACSAPTDGADFDAPGGDNRAGDGIHEGTEPGSKDGDGDDEDPIPSKAGCEQEEYTEPLPTNASLAGLSYASNAADDYLLAALGLRFPAGKAIVEGGLASPLSKTHGNCILEFLGDKSSASAILRQAATVVHECGHFLELGLSSNTKTTVVIRPDDLVFSCHYGDTTSRSGRTFARSLIKGDAHYAKRPACPAGTSGADCDMYAGVYLNGDPSNATFESGDQGYNSLLEEAGQYVNSLAAALAFHEHYEGYRATERDGILTFLWYVQRYLAMARTDYPEAYAHLSGDACWRQATLTIWDRAWFYLDATDSLSSLGISDAQIEPLVREPALLAEIDALRTLECE